MIQTQPTTDSDLIIADLPYPQTGSSQFLVICHCAKSERPPDDSLFLDQRDLSRTVLAGAFCPDKEVAIRTPLPPPYDIIKLPPISRKQLREEVVRDETGIVLGVMLRLPGVFVHANRILTNFLANNTTYDYKDAIVEMVKESGRLLASVVKSGIIRVRSHPGIMGHALEMEELAADEIGISVGFAEKVLKKVQDKLPLQFGSVWDLDGFPVYAVRFPVANRFGVQGNLKKPDEEKTQYMYLRILPGHGRYIACNPFNLGKRWLGDRDGDMLFSLLRWEDVKEGNIEIAKRPRIEVNTKITNIKSCMTLQGLLDPTTIECEEKLQQKMVSPDLTTMEARLQYIKDADTRTHVATYTMVFGWWVPRVLAASGRYSPQEAYRKGNDLLEIFIEWCMDARKGGSPLSDARFDGHRFMRLLRFGKRSRENLDFGQLRELGVPPDMVDILEEAWEISDGNLAEYCGRSPFYRGLILGRNTQERSIPQMLLAAEAKGIKPEDLYMAIINDLTCKECVIVDREE